MNKKQKTYSLLVAVIFIWGIIGYKIYNRLSPNKIVTSVANVSHFSPKKIVDVKPYAIKANYRDPFLGKLISNSNKKTVKPKKTVKKEEKKNFPHIIYNGTVESNNSKSYIITINGTQEIFVVGQSIHDVKLVKGTSENVVLKFQDQTKTFNVQ